jgi:hypothetical protein
MKKLLAAAVSLLVGTVQAQVLSELHARDIHGDGSVDAFYDSLLDVTWLADANHYLTAGFPPEYDYIATTEPIACTQEAHSPRLKPGTSTHVSQTL